MLNDKIKYYRQLKGMSQEELADKLKVVRQTVSKWEKGISVPDADMLVKLSEEFDVSINDLLGFADSDKTDVDEVAEKLASINNQLAIRNRRAKKIWRVLLIVVLLIVVFKILLIFLLSPVGDHHESGISVSVERIEKK